MSDTNTTEEQLTIDQWRQIRKEEGLKLNEETAEVMWWYALTLDPYGVYPNLPLELQCIGREWFARSPESDIWVWFGDLPKVVRERLWKRGSIKASISRTSISPPDCALRANSIQLMKLRRMQ